MILIGRRLRRERVRRAMAAGTWRPGAAALAAALTALTFPRFDWGPLAFVSWLPLLLAIEGERPGRAFALGMYAGTILYAINLWWITHVTTTYGGLPFVVGGLVLALLAGYLALYVGAFCAAWAWCRAGSEAGRLLFAPALWVSLEYLRTHLLTGFPWALTAYSQHANLPLVQVAAWTGMYGVSFLVLLMNAAALLAWRGRARPVRSAATLVIPAGFIVLASLAGVRTMAGGPPAPALSVAPLQGNIAQEEKWTPAMRARTLDIYERLTRRVAGGRPALIVWPETAIPFFLRLDAEALERVAATARAAGAHLLVGAPDVRAGPPDRYYNSAFLFAPTGAIAAWYDKVHLVPFGEYVPRWLGFVNKLARGAIGDFSAGTEHRVLAIPGAKFGVTISYEVYFPAEVREFFRGGADFVVNLTNDAWYGRTAAPYQHLAMTVFRAVEHRAALVRAANTGLSAVVDPAGRVAWASDLFVEAGTTVAIARRTGETFYTRFGDLFAWAAMGFSLAWLAANAARRRASAPRP
jgi:apolipoprotein N-acyltransferase